MLKAIPIVQSLSQLLERHPALLVVDTSSTRAEAALWQHGAVAPPQVAHGDGEASATLTEVIATVLTAAKLSVRELDAAAFCAGPGSVLGIRLAAATLRAWRAIKPSLETYSFQSLPLLAASYPKHAILADARRETWHIILPGQPHQMQRVPASQLPSLARINLLGTPASFRRWSVLPTETNLLPLEYSAAELLRAAPETPFFTPSYEPEAYLADSATYVTWTPQIHQAPARESRT